MDLIDPRRIARLLHRPHEDALGPLLGRLRAEEDAHRRLAAGGDAGGHVKQDEIGLGPRRRGRPSVGLAEVSAQVFGSAFDGTRDRHLILFRQYFGSSAATR
jgi:hypothetical protein